MIVGVTLHLCVGWHDSSSTEKDGAVLAPGCLSTGWTWFSQAHTRYGGWG